jgi:hypothetical protein
MTMANNPPRDIQTLVDNHIIGFNTHNIELFLSVFGDTAIIIDGIAPYRWLNPNAPANWLADVEKWCEDLGVSYEHLSYEMGFWNVEGSDAYAVISGTPTVTIKGQTVVRTGTLAYTFSKHGEEWKIDAQAWGRTS